MASRQFRDQSRTLSSISDAPFPVAVLVGVTVPVRQLEATTMHRTRNDNGLLYMRPVGFGVCSLGLEAHLYCICCQPPSGSFQRFSFCFRAYLKTQHLAVGSLPSPARPSQSRKETVETNQSSWYGQRGLRNCSESRYGFALAEAGIVG